MDGLEATRRLRVKEALEENTSRRHTIIGVSANADQDVVVEALSAGVDEFMCKPFSFNEFVQVYQRITES